MAGLEPPDMDKLKLKEQNLGPVFNSRHGRAYIGHAIVQITKQTNLKLKTRPQQLLDSLPLALPPDRYSIVNQCHFLPPFYV
jgi:hypothetical protein